MATAVSGSGPAYVFLFIEAFIDAAVHLGWPRQQAEKLVLQTVRGFGPVRGALRGAYRRSCAAG